MKTTIFLNLVVLLVTTASGQAATRLVPDEYATIQDAIDAAVDGDVVIIAPDTYTGDGNRDIDFHGKAITVRSQNGPENCIIDCNGTETEPHRGFYFHSDESEDSVVNGFTIANGYAHNGGGIYCDGASPTITNNVITNNVANSLTITPSSGGGGISCYNNSSAIIMNNIIADNYVRGFGGGICIHSSSVSIINNTITNNISSSAWFQSTAGGIDCRYSSSVVNTIVNTIIWGNINNDSPKQIEGCANVTYSDIQDGYEGEGNIDVNPYFADLNNGDYHLKSQAGRWDANEGRWTKNDVTSSCIDAGDPKSPIGYEPFPNGGVINMGAYGGTAEASKSYFGEPVCETIVAGDINGDCKVNFVDFGIMASHWLEDNSLYREVPEFYYYSSNRKIYLDIYTAMITVCFEETVTDPEREAVIKQDPILEAIVAEMARYGVVLVGTKAGSSEIDIIQTIERLEKLPEVRYSTPVFGDSATQLILTDEFLAKFKPDVTEEEIDAFNALNSVEIARKMLLKDWYVLRVKDPTNMNTLKTANLYYENPITIYSVPNFIGIGELP